MSAGSERQPVHREPRPRGDDFAPAAPAVSGLDRDPLRRAGLDPALALAQSAEDAGRDEGRERRSRPPAS
ncbi:hypothetical protein OQI_35330 [Streptomyces pharetrae CZA14]|uniref:Uncharacterized protein n=1 Tax=Streptomyces pharetrae CZA14 TaxID=1144883 RepID=A0ABX3Y826_9ACTN|nr:hypothetical protein OQI_35330 [Streptomyces pharetrae CZA14]